MKKILVLALALVFVASAPVLARTKYDKYGHKITPQKKTKVQAAAKVQNANDQVDPEMKMRSEEMQQTKKEEKVKEKTIQDARGRSMGKVVRDGESNNFTMYDQRGRKMGSYVEDDNGNGKFYDVRGREISRSSRQTQDIK